MLSVPVSYSNPVENPESVLESVGLTVRLSDEYSLNDLLRVKLGMDLRKELIDDYIKYLFKDIPEVCVFSSKLFHHCKSRTKVTYSQRSMPNLSKDLLRKDVLIFCLPGWKIGIVFHPELVKEGKNPPMQMISQEKGEFRQEILFMKK